MAGQTGHSTKASNNNADEREVLDPVVHRPVRIHDRTAAELDEVTPLNLPESSTSLPLYGAVMDKVVSNEAASSEWKWESTRKAHLSSTFTSALSSMFGATAGMAALWGCQMIISPNSALANALVVLPSLAVGASSAAVASLYLSGSPPKETDESDDDRHEDQMSQSPESAMWLNSFLKSLWPIINPSLFIAVSDMLEDSLQATMPSMIHAVRVADLGQGTEPLRILGVRGLPLDEPNGPKKNEGTHVNLEVAFAYRARKEQHSSANNAHVLLQFWTAGSVVLPVWVELGGIIATVRMRIQLNPDPPFLSAMTLTLLGQPKISLKCTPLAKGFLDIMDIPGLSKWIQGAIDSAVQAYVAPRSLQLDLKTMLSGKDAQDTNSLGVIFIRIISSTGAKSGDAHRKWTSRNKQQSDPYVTVGWQKWGKPMFSTRIIEDEDAPVFDESTGLLVTPADVNAEEKIQLQLWDSDRFSADDLLGTIEVPLEEIMTSEATLNRMSDRQDSYSVLDKDCPGTMQWSCGYFEKTTLHQCLEETRSDIATDAESAMREEAQHRIREASAKDATNDIEEKKRDLAEELIAATKPAERWPSGILSVRIVQITGLEVQKVRESGVKNTGELEEDDDAPSAYCTISINHQRVFQTRTKMKDSKPYYDAATEKFIPDWRNALVMITVRDYRLHEQDPILGVVALPLSQMLKERSQISITLPLIGGVGYGRIKFSLIFRGVQATLPRQLLGWPIGTLVIEPQGTSDKLSSELSRCRLVFKTLYGKGRMMSNSDGTWHQRRDSAICLPVKNRYASCLVVQFKRQNLGPDITPAFCVLWLKDIPDEEDIEVSLPVRQNVGKEFARARTNATDDGAQPLGYLRLKVRFWSGLSGYHKRLAGKDEALGDVMEGLDCIEENTNGSDSLEAGSNSSSSSSSSSSSDDEDSSLGSKKSSLQGGFKGFKSKQKDLQSKHRGLMQWSGMRKAAWFKHKVVDETSKRLSGHFDRQQVTEGSIDTEV